MRKSAKILMMIKVKGGMTINKLRNDEGIKERY